MPTVTESFHCRLVGNTAMMFVSIILSIYMTGMKCISYVKKYLKYKVADIGNNFLVLDYHNFNDNPTWSFL